MKNNTSVTVRLHQKMRMLMDIIRYVSNYAYEHNMTDLLVYISEKLTEIEEVEE